MLLLLYLNGVRFLCSILKHIYYPAPEHKLYLIDNQLFIYLAQVLA